MNMVILRNHSIEPPVRSRSIQDTCNWEESSCCRESHRLLFPLTNFRPSSDGRVTQLPER
jgi:hypothetical protein